MSHARFALQVNGLTKDFAAAKERPSFRAVDGLSFDVRVGEVVGLLGPNGCGKSTTLKMIAGLTPPSAGAFRVFDEPGMPRALRQRIGYVPEPLPLHRHLTAREMVQFHGRLAGLGGDRLTEQIERVLADVGLTEAADRRVGTFSTGMLRRVALAQALVHEPELLLLDEPTAGVDPAGVADVLQIISAQRQAGRTVVLASHLMGQVETICDRVALLDRGRLLAFDTVAALVGSEGESWVIDGLTEQGRQALKQWVAEQGALALRPSDDGTALQRVFLRKIAPSPPLRSG